MVSVVEKNKVMVTIVVVIFLSVFEKKKKMTTTFVTFFDGFVAKIDEGNYRNPF